MTSEPDGSNEQYAEHKANGASDDPNLHVHAPGQLSYLLHLCGKVGDAILGIGAVGVSVFACVHDVIHFRLDWDSR